MRDIERLVHQQPVFGSGIRIEGGYARSSGKHRLWRTGLSPGGLNSTFWWHPHADTERNSFWRRSHEERNRDFGPVRDHTYTGDGRPSRRQRNRLETRIGWDRPETPSFLNGGGNAHSRRAAQVSSRRVEVGAGNGTINAATGRILDLLRILTGSGGLSKLGPGTLAMSGDLSGFTVD